MAIMRVMNLENRIQTLQTVPAKMTDSELAGHFSGTWICFTTMRLNGQLGRGIMEIRLEQEGDELVGEGAQLKHPFDPPSTVRPIGTRSATVSDFIGQFKKAQRHHMVVIERRRVPTSRSHPKSFSSFLLTAAMMTRLLPLSLALFATTSPLSAKDSIPLMIYAVSIGEEKAVVVKFHEKDGKAILDVVQSEPLGAPAGSITHHPDHNLLYIGAKNGRGFVYAVNDDEKIEKVREMPFKSGYCFLSLDRSGRYLLGSSYESGNLDVYRLDAEGLPEKLVDSRNEKKTMAHSVGVSSDNRSVYVPYVKKENALYQYRFDPETGKLSSGAPANIEIPDAVGPRHLAFHPTKPYVYFSNEQQLGVSAFKIGPKGGLQRLQICAALETPPAEGMAASDIAITPDGRFLYVPVRGFGKPLNAVFGYAIGEGGRLKSLGMTATDSIPWALGMSPHGDHLFVTSSRQGSLAAYAIDNKGGLKKEASVKIGERFWDILVLRDASE